MTRALGTISVCPTRVVYLPGTNALQRVRYLSFIESGVCAISVDGQVPHNCMYLQLYDSMTVCNMRYIRLYDCYIQLYNHVLYIVTQLCSCTLSVCPTCVVGTRATSPWYKCVAARAVPLNHRIVRLPDLLRRLGPTPFRVLRDQIFTAFDPQVNCVR